MAALELSDVALHTNPGSHDIPHCSSVTRIVREVGKPGGTDPTSRVPQARSKESWVKWVRPGGIVPVSWRLLDRSRARRPLRLTRLAGNDPARPLDDKFREVRDPELQPTPAHAGAAQGSSPEL